MYRFFARRLARAGNRLRFLVTGSLLFILGLGLQSVVAQAQQMGQIGYNVLECQGCKTQIAIEVNGANIKHRYDLGYWDLELVYREQVYKSEDILFVADDKAIVVFEFQLWHPGENRIIARVADYSSHIKAYGEHRVFFVQVAPVHRMLDSAVDPCVLCQVVDDSLARFAGLHRRLFSALTTDGFYIRSPKIELRNKRGLMFRHGYDKYYLHIARSDMLQLGVRLMGNAGADSLMSLPTDLVERTPYGTILYFKAAKARPDNLWYFAVISKQKRLRSRNTRLRSRALYLRAIEYNPNQKAVQLLKTLAIESQKYRDSLYRAGQKAGAGLSAMHSIRLRHAIRKAQETRHEYELYQLFDNILTGKAKRAQRKALRKARNAERTLKQDSLRAAQAAAAKQARTPPDSLTSIMGDTTALAPPAPPKPLTPRQIKRKAQQEARENERQKKLETAIRNKNRPVSKNDLKNNAKRLIKFFAYSHYIHDRTMKYTIMSAPYGLPKIGRDAEKDTSR
jgi:hypothetical protein